MKHILSNNNFNTKYYAENYETSGKPLTKHLNKWRYLS